MTRACGFLLALIVIAATALAQPATRPSTGPSTQSTAATQPAVPPPPIAANEIISTSETTLLALQNMVNLPPNSTVQTVEQDLPGMTSDIEDRAEETERILEAHASLQTVRNLQSEWETSNETLSDWRSEVTAYSKELTDRLNRLVQMQSDWQRTLDWANQVNASSELVTAINATLKDIWHTEGQLGKMRSQIWALNRRVDAQDARVEQNLAEVKHSREQIFSRMLLRDSPPLWAAFQGGQAGPVEGGQNGFSRQASNFRGYIQRHAERLGIHAFVLIVFCAVLIWIRRRLRVRAGDDPELARAMAVFERPLATGIVLSFVVSLWIYPDAPQLLRALIGAVALVPTVIIVRQLIDRRLYGILNILVVLFLLDQLRSILTWQPLVYRLLFLAELAAITIYIIVLVRRFPAPNGAEGKPVRRWTIAQIVARTAIAFFAFGLVANVVGYCALANFLGDALLASTYLALILYASTRIALGLVIFAVRAWPLNLLHAVQRHESLLVRRIGFLLDWAAGFLWLYESLDLFNIRDEVIEWTRRALAATLEIGSISLSLGHVLAFGVTVWAAFLISRLARFVLEEDVFARFDLPSGIPYAISRVLHYVILVWGFCIAVAALGYDMTKFTILAGAFGVGLGFGMQNIVNNFVSGIILLFERPIKVGDVIQMDSTTGVVEHIGIRASIMQTPDGSEIIVPNGTLLSNQVTNWTLSNGRHAVVVQINIAPGPDPNQLIRTLTEAAQKQPKVLSDPPAQAYVTKVTSDALTVEIHAWTEGADNWVKVRSDLTLAVYTAALAQGITLK